MAKHTALLLGCGTIGAAVARLLVADEIFSGVLIADKDVARTHQIPAEIGGKVQTLQQPFSLLPRLTICSRVGSRLPTSHARFRHKAPRMARPVR